MQDGQNLFSDALAFSWVSQVDESIERLSALGLEAIVVGVPNAGEGRILEYSPFPTQDGKGRGDRYLEFIVEELLPRLE